MRPQGYPNVQGSSSSSSSTSWNDQVSLARRKLQDLTQIIQQIAEAEEGIQVPPRLYNLDSNSQFPLIRHTLPDSTSPRETLRSSVRGTYANAAGGTDSSLSNMTSLRTLAPATSTTTSSMGNERGQPGQKESRPWAYDDSDFSSRFAQWRAAMSRNLSEINRTGQLLRENLERATNRTAPKSRSATSNVTPSSSEQLRRLTMDRGTSTFLEETTRPSVTRHQVSHCVTQIQSNAPTSSEMIMGTMEAAMRSFSTWREAVHEMQLKRDRSNVCTEASSSRANDPTPAPVTSEIGVGTIEPPSALLACTGLMPAEAHCEDPEANSSSLENESESSVGGMARQESTAVLEIDRNRRKPGRPSKNTKIPDDTEIAGGGSTSAAVQHNESDDFSSPPSLYDNWEPRRSGRKRHRNWMSDRGHGGKKKPKYDLRRDTSRADYSKYYESD